MTEETKAGRRIGARGLAASLAMAAIVALLWGFPRLWYTASAGDSKPIWFATATELSGYTYVKADVSESAERLLTADSLFNGEFENANGEVVRTFSAKRYTSKPYDIGLFQHTPDRCWTQGGWQMEVTEPETVEVDVHGVRMLLERRIFVGGSGLRELVYFGGLVGGHQLPYRLDHNYSVGLKYAVNSDAKSSRTYGFGMRLVDPVFWGRVWDGFTSRRPLQGPKQFVRISTTIRGGDVEAADRLLQDFLPLWLKPVDYATEMAAWQSGQEVPSEG